MLAFTATVPDPAYLHPLSRALMPQSLYDHLYGEGEPLDLSDGDTLDVYVTPGRRGAEGRMIDDFGIGEAL